MMSCIGKSWAGACCCCFKSLGAGGKALESKAIAPAAIVGGFGILLLGEGGDGGRIFERRLV